MRAMRAMRAVSIRVSRRAARAAASGPIGASGSAGLEIAGIRATAAARVRRSTWPYVRSTIRVDRWPSSSATALRGTSALTRVLAKVRRRSFGEQRGMPARAHAWARSRRTLGQVPATGPCR